MTESDALQLLLAHPQGPFPDEVWEHVADLFERADNPTNVISHEMIAAMVEASVEAEE